MLHLRSAEPGVALLHRPKLRCQRSSCIIECADAGARARRVREKSPRFPPPVDSRPELARAWEAAGEPDSAIAVYERYVGARALFRAELDAFELARAYDRLAALHERRNNHNSAATAPRRAP